MESLGRALGPNSLKSRPNRKPRRDPVTREPRSEGYHSDGPIGRVWVARLRPLAVVTLVFVGWWAIGPWNFAQAIELGRIQEKAQAAAAQAVQTHEARSRRTPPGPATRLAESLDAAQRIVARIEDRSATRLAESESADNGSPARLTSGDLQALAAVREEIAARGERLLTQIETAGRRVAASSLPKSVRARQRQKLAEVRRGLETVRSALREIGTSPADELPARLAEVRALLGEATGPSLHNPLDPERLPFRPAEPASRSPRSETPSAASGAAVAVAAATPPTPADLAETPEVQLTEGIVSQAEALGSDPLAIYNWVRQNIRFVPTFGSIQGAEACRLSRECNAFDTASLLIALLRASGVPARYVTGTVEISPELFASAVGDFEDLASAARLAASGGIPVVTVTGSDGEPRAVRLEHAWVEAFVDYVPSRGASGTEGNTWVPLDPVLKRTRFQQPIHPGEALGLDDDAIVQGLLDTGTFGPDGFSISDLSLTEFDATRQQIADDFIAYLDQNLPADATVGDVIGAVEIEAPPLTVLPGGLPGRILTVASRSAELPAATRHRVTVQLLDRFALGEELRLDRSTAELAGRRLTLGYIPATLADQETLDAFGGLYQTPPYLVEMVPVLYLDGEPVASGSPVHPGTRQTVRVGFREPGAAADSVDHVIAAGTWAAVGLDLQQVSPDELRDRSARLEAANDLVGVEDVNADDIVGELLHIHALTYFAQVESYSRVMSHQLDVATLKRPAEMLATLAPSFAFAFGSAVDVVNVGMNVDVRRYIVSAASRTGDRDAERSWIFGSGILGSGQEHSVFETLQQGQAVSAVKLLTEAQRRGIPVFAVTASNVDQVLPQLNLSSAVIADIRNSVAAGKQALVPRDNVPLLDWQGVGYIVLDRETGAAAYLISGGLAGGGTAEGTDLLEILQELVSKLSVLSDIGELIFKVKPFRFGAKLPVIGQVLSVVDAILTGIDIAQRTGDPWTGLLVGSIVFLVNLAIATVLGAFTALLAEAGLFGLFLAIAYVLMFAFILTLLQNGILDTVFPEPAALLSLLRKAAALLASAVPKPALPIDALAKQLGPRGRNHLQPAWEVV